MYIQYSEVMDCWCISSISHKFIVFNQDFQKALSEALTHIK